MLQKLILAATLTFALYLLLGMRPPLNTQTVSHSKIDLAHVLKVRIINLASSQITEK